MIHYSCDRCGHSIDANDEIRYVVRMEVEAVMSSPCDAAPEENDDHLMSLDQILDLAEASLDPMVSDAVYHRKRYDLCSSCQRKFVADPLGTEEPVALDFSTN